MKKFDSEFDIVSLAWQIIEMNNTIQDQASEIAHLKGIKEQYDRLLDADIKHGEAMMGNLLKLCITPGVVEACLAAKEKENVQDR